MQLVGGQIGVICGSKIVGRRLQGNIGYTVLKRGGMLCFSKTTRLCDSHKKTSSGFLVYLVSIRFYR